MRQQLGDAHPLVGTLRKGVGFHHAGLPVEVLEALEAAVREDSLPYLTCTSTLTDGVNLPVRTVVLYDAPYPDQPEDSRLRGARLVNAMGRAGRAGRETEGWIVLVRAAEPSEQDFSDLNPDADDLKVTSTLITDSALQTISELEETTRAGHDAIFSARGTAADFVSFVWSMLATAEQLNDESIARPDALIDSTLAARQSGSARQRYLRIAEATRAAYVTADPGSRLRWSRVGSSIGSARKIDALAQQVATSVLQGDRRRQIATSSGAVALLGEAIDELLELDESPKWEFRVSVQGQRIEVGPTTLLLDWLSGRSLPELADRHLPTATDPAWRVEQMVNITTAQFEHYLSWTLGALVELVNSLLESHECDERVCPELAGYVRYGVKTPTALRLMSEGMHSRRISNLIADRLPTTATMGIDELRRALGAMSVEDWRSEFSATASEVADLLDFTRQRRRSLLKLLLDTGTASLPVVMLGDLLGRGELRIRTSAARHSPGSLGIFEGDRRVAVVGSQDYSDVQAILNTGFTIELSIDTRGTESKVHIHLALEPAADRLI